MSGDQEVYQLTQLPVSPDSVIMRSVIKKAPPHDERFALSPSAKGKMDEEMPMQTDIDGDFKADADDMDFGDGKSSVTTSTDENKISG